MSDKSKEQIFSHSSEKKLVLHSSEKKFVLHSREKKGPFQKKISIQPSGYLGFYLGYTADFLATGIFLRFEDISKYPRDQGIPNKEVLLLR